MTKTLVARLLLLTGCMIAATCCTSETDYGKCIGAFDTPDPKLKYETSTTNVVLAVVFVETIFAPILVVAKETRCPYDYADKQ
jgi:hypothetical protein